MFFFFNDTATTEIYSLSLHDALPISATRKCSDCWRRCSPRGRRPRRCAATAPSCSRRSGSGGRRSASSTRRSGRYFRGSRSEEHTSELQSRQYLVCRLLLEKKTTYLVSYIDDTRCSIAVARIGRRAARLTVCYLVVGDERLTEPQRAYGHQSQTTTASRY